jgi:hypothetical protein
MGTRPSPPSPAPKSDNAQKWLRRVEYGIMAAVAVSLVVRGLFAWAIAYRTNGWRELAESSLTIISLHVLAVPYGLLYLASRFSMKGWSVSATVATCVLLLSLPGLLLVSEAGASTGRNMLSSELNLQRLAQECLQIALAPRNDSFVPENEVAQYPMLSRLRPRGVRVLANQQVDVYLHWGRGESAWGYSLRRVPGSPAWELTELRGGKVLATVRAQDAASLKKVPTA